MMMLWEKIKAGFNYLPFRTTFGYLERTFDRFLPYIGQLPTIIYHSTKIASTTPALKTTTWQFIHLTAKENVTPMLLSQLGQIVLQESADALKKSMVSDDESAMMTCLAIDSLCFVTKSVLFLLSLKYGVTLSIRTLVYLAQMEGLIMQHRRPLKHSLNNLCQEKGCSPLVTLGGGVIGTGVHFLTQVSLNQAIKMTGFSYIAVPLIDYLAARYKMSLLLNQLCYYDRLDYLKNHPEPAYLLAMIEGCIRVITLKWLIYPLVDYFKYPEIALLYVSYYLAIFPHLITLLLATQLKLPHKPHALSTGNDIYVVTKALPSLETLDLKSTYIDLKLGLIQHDVKASSSTYRIKICLKPEEIPALSKYQLFYEANQKSVDPVKFPKNTLTFIELNQLDQLMLSKGGFLHGHYLNNDPLEGFMLVTRIACEIVFKGAASVLPGYMNRTQPMSLTVLNWIETLRAYSSLLKGVLLPFILQHPHSFFEDAIIKPSAQQIMTELVVKINSLINLLNNDLVDTTIKTFKASSITRKPITALGVSPGLMKLVLALLTNQDIRHRVNELRGFCQSNLLTKVTMLPTTNPSLWLRSNQKTPEIIHDSPALSMENPGEVIPTKVPSPTLEEIADESSEDESPENFIPRRN